MGENSNIEWTKHTFNGWIGCTKVGPGCDNCYAEVWDARGLQGDARRWGPHAARTRTSPANWRKPLAWDRAAAAAGERHRVFCSSLADVFDNHASILPEWRADLWALISATPNLDWMLLTKRPGNIGNMLPVPFSFDTHYPNVWLGCTITSRAEMLRDAPKLKSVDARVRFWSVEPLLGDIGKIPCDLLPDLVIVGGESGPRARPMHPDWVRSLRDQCKAAGVAFHFKQWGEWEVALDRDRDDPDWRCDYSNNYIDRGKSRWLNLAGGCGFHGDRFCVMRRVGKKAAGRLLDGRTWDEMPGGMA